MRFRPLFLVLAVNFGLAATQSYADFGNAFVANQRLSTPITSSTQKLSYRFTCQDDMSATAAAVYCTDALHAPAYLVKLEDDDHGVPSGNVLAWATFVPKAQNWSTLPFDAAPLLKGQVYHLVLEPDMLRGGGHPVAIIGKKNYASFLTTDVLNHLHPNDGSPDTQTNTLFFENGKWKVQDQEPVYALYGQGDRAQGNPYDDPSMGPIYGKTWQGEILHFHCPDQIDHIAFRVKKQGHPTTPLQFSVLINDFANHKCIPYYTGASVPIDQVTSDFQWVTIGIPMPTSNMFRAECWLFILKSASGHSADNAVGCDDCYALSDVGNSGGLPDAANLTFDGGPHRSRGVYSTEGDDLFHWQDEFERDSNVVAANANCPTQPEHTFKPLPTPQPLDEEDRLNP